MSKRGLEHLMPFDLDFQCESACIWVVDDEPSITRLAQLYLNRAGFSNVESINDPAAVLAKLEHQQPDLIVLDIEMPAINGMQILQQIRAIPKYSEISIIILSGTDKATKYRSLKLGAVDFIDKPVDADELELRIRKALRVI